MTHFRVKMTFDCAYNSEKGLYRSVQSHSLISNKKDFFKYENINKNVKIIYKIKNIKKILDFIKILVYDYNRAKLYCDKAFNLIIL